MNNKTSWDPAFAVGNEELDVQHKALFSLESTLHGDLSDEKVRLIISELHRFMMIHFETEEQFMQSMDYPHLDEHKQQHNELINKLRKLDQLDFTSEGPQKSLKKFMTAWLADHVLYEDIRYANYYKNSLETAAEPSDDPEETEV